MQDLSLLAAIAAVFVCGWFFVKRLDHFLENQCQAQEQRHLSGEGALRIGFSDPSVADSITNVLERFSKAHPDISVSLFHGSAEELIGALSARKLDVVFFPEHAAVPTGAHYHVREVWLGRTPILLKYARLPVEPIADGGIVQNVYWPEERTGSFVHYFIECLTCEFAQPKP